MPNPAEAVRTSSKLGPSPLEKVILGAIAGVAGVIGVFAIIGLVDRIVALVGSGPIALPNVPLADPVPAGLDGSPAITSSAYDSVTLVMADLPDAARAALVAEAAVTSMLTLGICAAVVWLCLRVFVGRPFVRSATAGISMVAILVLLVGLGAPFLRGVANTEAVAFAGHDEVALLLFDVSLAPLGWAFALIVVAAAFEIGQRLQRETEGLV